MPPPVGSTGLPCWAVGGRPRMRYMWGPRVLSLRCLTRSAWPVQAGYRLATTQLPPGYHWLHWLPSV